MKKGLRIAGFALMAASVLAFTGCPTPEEPTEATVEKITVIQGTASVSFGVGEEFTADGITVKATMSDKTTKTLTTDEYDVRVPDANKDAEGKLKLSDDIETGKHSQEVEVTVAYKAKDGIKATYNIVIAKGPDSLILNVDEVNTEYEIGDSFDDSDITVTAVYGEDEEDVTEDAEITVEDFSSEEAGTVTVKVKASYAGKEVEKEVEVTVTDPDNVDLSTYFHAYLKGAGDDDYTIVASWQDWGSGTVSEDLEGNALKITSGKGWGADIATFAYGLNPGYLKKFDYVVLTADISGIELTERTTGNTGAFIRFTAPEQDLTLTDYQTENEDGTVTYVIPVSEITADGGQISPFFCGAGSVTVKEFYFAAKTEPDPDNQWLLAAIDAAQTVRNGAEIGTDPDTYPQEAADTLDAAIEAAQTVADKEDGTQKEFDEAVNTLNKAVEVFAGTKIPNFPFTALSGTEIPAGAKVIFSSKNAAETLFGGTETWWVADGFTIKQSDFNEEKVIEVVTKGENACGCYDLNVDVKAGDKLYVSCYSTLATAIKPVAPDAETAVQGKDDWQLLVVEYTADSNLHQFGIVGKTAEENSLFIDAVYIVSAE